MKINRNIHAVVSPKTSLEIRLCAARGEAELIPGDKLTAVILLTRDTDTEVKHAAIKTLKNFPPIELISAIEARLDPAILNTIARVYKENPIVLERLIANPCTSNDTVAIMAESASAFLAELIAGQTERLRDSKDIAIALAANPEVLEDLLERLIEASEPKAEDTEETGGASETKTTDEINQTNEDEDNTDDSTNEEFGEIEEAEPENLFQMVSRMTVADKMKLALKGNNEARGLLIKDSNKIVSSSVLKNPKITDEEVIRLTASNGTPEDLLRIVARGKEWMKSSQIKKNLVTNPKTPLAISMKLVRSLDKKSLEKIGKSKNIPNALATEARKALMLKKKHG